MEAAELHQLARAGETPREFSEQRDRLKGVQEVLAQERATMHELIVEAHKLGVGPAALARWSGYDPSRIYQILG